MLTTTNFKKAVLAAALALFISAPVALAQQPVKIVTAAGVDLVPSADATSGSTAPTSGPLTFCVASSTAPTAVTNGQAIGCWVDLNGRMHIVGDASMTPVLATLSGTNHVIIDSGSTTVVTGNVSTVGAAASGAAKSGNPVQVGAVFNTTQPTVTTGQAVENQATARGAQIVATGVDTFNATINAALPAGSNVIGALTANQSVNNAQVNGVTMSTGTGAVGTGTQRVAVGTDSATIAGSAPGTAGTPSSNIVTVQGAPSMTAVKTDSSATTQPVSIAANVAVAGAAASGASKAGNPVQGGGVFNTTQPTVTTGQAVENQSTARGAQIVATGADTFNVTVNAAIPTGSNVIGALTANQSVNNAQLNGNAILAGNGTTGTGSQRVTISSDNSAVAGFGVGATGSAPPANASYMGGLIGGGTGGLLAGIPICDQQNFLNMTTATTTEIVPLTSGRTVHICHIRAEGGGTTTMTFKRGTATNCGTGTTPISEDMEITVGSGYTAGSGFGEVLDGRVAGNAVCVTNSAGVNLHVFVRYAVY